MTSYFCCPSCLGIRIETTQDYERNLLIIKCSACGEMYAVREEDVVNLGAEQIFREWHGSYMSQKRLEGGDD